MSASTTVPIGVAAVVVVAIVGGAWWAASVSGKVDILTGSNTRQETDLNRLKEDVGTMKYDMRLIQQSFDSIKKK